MSPSLQLPLLDGDEPRGEYEPLYLKGRPSRPRERSLLWLKAITTAVLVLIAILVFFFPDDARHYLHLPPPSSGHHTPTRDRIQDIVTSIIGSAPSPPPNTTAETIPNTAHFVYILQDPDADFHFEFSHYLAIYAAAHHWRPDTLYFHTNARPAALDRARAGTSGRWNALILNLPRLTVRAVTVPTHAGNGVALTGMEHKSDFVRVKAVHELGGVYVDWDRLVREEGEVLIVERKAFAPGGWGTGDVAELFAPHFGEKSNLDGKRQGDELGVFDEGPGVMGNNPLWARDWSFTYLLHAFRPGRASKNPWGFEAITPRYVFERQSNFARAVYPVAKDMYDRKIIQLDDSHEG
ncbi:conserved hypothetical protein [Verticillium alfalfae VaMs.102]|uniref:Glycosyl transferase n=1 Tax=Verticillium alfalfae (strain VaMs.102 / ATCC MYA-4576 / FGSC 10136) TaxID=526221 RepID=C9SW56_VERA1|nr:conserved hypothetical protein [Verticillium alfalfae VaMs.102]EEY23021.1 conserved hypothetical protein [Verticillium alfalfae VaMs.102]